jgi:hypothetical protein
VLVEKLWARPMLLTRVAGVAAVAWGMWLLRSA